MNVIYWLRNVNLLSSTLAIIVSSVLLVKVYKSYREVEDPKVRNTTGIALLGVASLFLLNSGMFAVTFLVVAVTNDPELLSVFGNIRALIINLVTILVSVGMIAIDRE